MVEIKATYGDTRARTTLEARPSPTYVELATTLAGLFKLASPTDIKIGYLDEEQDRVVLSTDEEVRDLWRQYSASNITLRLFVKDYRNHRETSTAQDPEEINVDSVKAAFETFVHNIEQDQSTSRDLFTSLSDLVHQALELTDKSADKLPEHDNGLERDVRHGVEHVMAHLEDMNLGDRPGHGFPGRRPRFPGGRPFPGGRHGPFGGRGPFGGHPPPPPPFGPPFGGFHYHFHGPPFQGPPFQDSFMHGPPRPPFSGFPGGEPPHHPEGSHHRHFPYPPEGSRHRRRGRETAPEETGSSDEEIVLLDHPSHRRHHRHFRGRR